MHKFSYAAIMIATLSSSSVGFAADYYLPIGTPVQLTTRTELNTKRLHGGEKFFLDVAPLVVKGHDLFPAGSFAVGEVGPVERNGHFGKSGKLNVRFLYVETPQGRIPITGDANARGKGATAATVGAWVAAGVFAAMVVHGTSGRIAAGTPVDAYVADDVSFYADDSAYKSLIYGGAVQSANR